jgi:hypothetical protein
MWVYFNIPEAEYLNFRMNEKKGVLMKVNLLMANNQIFEVSNLIDKRNNIYKVTIKNINSPEDGVIDDEIKVLVGSGDDYGYVSQK